jgi:hypothetical protein
VSEWVNTACANVGNRSIRRRIERRHVDSYEVGDGTQHDGSDGVTLWLVCACADDVLLLVASTIGARVDDRSAPLYLSQALCSRKALSRRLHARE